MADKFINETGVATIRDWVKTKFATTEAVQTLSDEVDQIIAEGGEPNVIETVKVNGTALTPDAQKAVDVTVPTKTSDLTNDSSFVVDTGTAASMDATSQNKLEFSTSSDSALSFEMDTTNNTVGMSITIEGDTPMTSTLATTDYVNQNGGKIDVIKVNGTTQTITNKEVDLAVAELELYSTTGPGPIYRNALIKTGEGESIRFSETSSNIDEISLDAVHNSGVNFLSGQLAKTSYVTNALTNYYTKAETYTQSEVDSAISSAVTSAYKYKGSVATVQDLPSSGQTVGDVYDVQATGVNYAWNGTAWDALGSYVDTSLYWTNQTGQTNTLVAMTVSEINTILNASA